MNLMNDNFYFKLKFQYWLNIILNNINYLSLNEELIKKTSHLPLLTPWQMTYLTWPVRV